MSRQQAHDDGPTIAEIQEALAFIPPDLREVWIRVGMALKAYLGDAGFAVWIAWSRQSSKYDEKRARYEWTTFREDGGINIETVFYLAIENGYRPKAKDENWAKRRQEASRSHAATYPVLKNLWEKASTASAEHPYLLKKQIEPHGARLDSKNRLLIPLRNVKDDLCGLQTIDAEGHKQAVKGSSTAGAFFVIGQIKDTIAVAEGFATAASIYQATGHASVFANGCGNLGSVSQALRQKYPEKQIIICADNDEPGLKAAKRAASNVSAKIAVPSHSEHRAQNVDFNDLYILLGRDAVRKCIQDAAAPASPRRFKLITASEVTPRPLRWLWGDWICRGMFHLLAGAPGTGKTNIALSIAATISQGGIWPDGSTAKQGIVVIWSGEDDIARVLRPRLAAAGAKLENIRFIVPEDAKSRPFDPSRDFPVLQQQLQAEGLDVALLIIDPVSSAVCGDSHKNAEVRRGLQPIIDFAAERDCAVLGISHFSKNSSGRNPVERVVGSIAFGAVPRIVMAASKVVDGQGMEKRVFVRTKSNLGIDNGGFYYELGNHPLAADITATCIRWGEKIEGPVRELLDSSDAVKPERNGGRADEATELLGELLRHKAVAAETILQEAERAGIPKRTVERAKERLGFKAYKGKDGKWYWPCLASAEHTPPDKTLGGLGGLGGLGNYADISTGSITPPRPPRPPRHEVDSNFDLQSPDVQILLETLPAGHQQAFYVFCEEAIKQGVPRSEVGTTAYERLMAWELDPKPIM